MDEFLPKAPYGTVVKNKKPRCTLTANFTPQLKLFDLTLPRRVSMRQNILDEVMRKTESTIEQENPMYEDPRDVIDKPAKPPRKRTIQAIAVSSPRMSKEHKSLLREQKRKLTKKYESLINTLMERCEENIISLSEKDSQISKLKEKLRTVLEYNRLFSEENDTLRTQYETLVKYVEECKAVIREERDRNTELEARRKELECRVNKFEVPDKDYSANQAIPLVEVCMSCSSRQIILGQAREQTSRLQKDMQAMKDVLYRLNVQLSRYQEKLRSNMQHLADGKGEAFKPGGLDSLITASLGIKASEAASADDGSRTKPAEDPSTARLVDLSGLLSAQALAPLFDAYQENLQEKDCLIADYEKQFEMINKKSKQILTENKTLSEKVASLEEEVVRARQSYKRSTVERETADIEKATLVERAERAETKLKEVYELYEDKMAAMMRDYETVHREYFTVKTALEASEGKMAQLDMLRARTVPADLHERRLDHCKRLLEELKHQYGMETERKAEQLAKLQQQMKMAEDKYAKVCKELETTKSELETALKNVRLYRKAAVIFRQRLKAASARASRVRSSVKRARNEPLRQALQALDKIKTEIKVVKSRAYSSLEELERRIVEQERRAANAHADHRRELERAHLALEHKENIIRSLIDKVADVEEVRLSQTNTQRLQGILDTSSESSTSPDGNTKEGNERSSKQDGSHERGSKQDGSHERGSKQDGFHERCSKQDGSHERGSKQDGCNERSAKRDGSHEKCAKRDGSHEKGVKQDGSCDRNVRLVPGDGGYFQEREGKRKGKG